ncbi:TRAP transporter small permease subunit [Reichenbachiella sp. MALMAid0571]|uniref:TRAP transporter small permease subunit n=1 Tax=Reichenbachiella sp. MALMAid0571 TaxID=3143939 RepID=UPI0032DE7130
MKQLSLFIENLIESTGKIVSWLSIGLIAIIGIDVLLRYAFNKSTAALFELEWHLFAIIFMIGAAYTLKYDKHVRVDIFYTNFSRKQKAWINLIGTAFFLIPFCVIIITTSIPFVMASYNIMESSADPGGLPYRFMIKATIPIGISLLLLQGISELLKSLLVILNKETESIDE